jgi:hypothetical protein
MKILKYCWKIFMIAVLFTMINVSYAYADPNMDGGGSGGGTQNGTDDNFYSSGDDGVRITVINTETNRKTEGTLTIDYYKKNKDGKTINHFGKSNKLEYMGAAGYSDPKSLSLFTDYYLINGQGNRVGYHITDLPIIVSSSQGNSNIEELKSYFNDSARLQLIATRVGMNYETMISGKYKLIIEPVIYLTFEGIYIAMTAHEAALLDMMLGGTQTTGGALRAKFVSFTHRNLPLSIFLEKKELGVKRWTGSKYDRVQNGNILQYLGIGILSFNPGEDEEGILPEPDIDGGSFTYRPDTDVITSVLVSENSGSNGATSDNPITVRFSGSLITTTEVSGIVIPPGGSRLVWFKWHTPATTEKVTSTIYVNVMGGAASGAINIKINPIEEKEPPNPTADDKKPFGWSDIFLPSIPVFPKSGALYGFSSPKRSASWHTYTCTKSYEWTGDYYTDAEGNEVEDEYGNKIPIYQAVYHFTTNYYSASFASTNVSITPDATVSEANPNPTKVKSGYGIEMRANTSITSTMSSAVTGMQTAVAYFPEFKYANYRRIGKLPGASLNSTIQLPINLYSIRKNRVHFLPIWYPDKEYKVYVEILDAWTPAGMLCDWTTSSINVKGSMWDDYYIQVLPE